MPRSLPGQTPAATRAEQASARSFRCPSPSSMSRPSPIAWPACRGADSEVEGVYRTLPFAIGAEPDLRVLAETLIVVGHGGRLATLSTGATWSMPNLGGFFEASTR